MQIPIDSLNLLMLNVGMARHDGDWNWKDVSSPFARIYYVLAGEALLHLPGATQVLRPGHLYLVPAHTTHSYECTGSFTHYYLHVYEGFKNEASVMDLYTFPAEVPADDVDELLFRKMCRQHPDACLPESNPEAYDNMLHFSGCLKRYHDMPLWEKMELRGAVLTLFARFLRAATPKVWTEDERLKKVLDYVQQHIGESIDLEAMASVACVTKPYLIRLFRREFGTSPVQYINRKKVERAQLLLFTTNKPVKEIAYAMGFNDNSYFVRLFRKLSGMTPQQYRTQVG